MTEVEYNHFLTPSESVGLGTGHQYLLTPKEQSKKSKQNKKINKRFNETENRKNYEEANAIFHDILKKEEV